MFCSRCFARAYLAVLDVHGNPNATQSARMHAARRLFHSSTLNKTRIRRPSRIFDPPASTAVDKRGKLLTRGGEKPLLERKTAPFRSRSAIGESNDHDGATRVDGFFKSSSKELQVERDQRKTDPAKIARAVEKALNGTSKEHEEAIELLRELTSRYGRRDLVVAWNHAIEWKLKRKQIQGAMKLYNEMKKRGTKPDSYTYLRILNGLAECAPSVPSALGQALTIFYSMTAPSSTVKPSIMHTNAVLKVCAHAKDVDAMWDIAERIPDKGKGQADSLTYTTLLNGIRGNIDESPNTAVTEGRELWENILIKWQEGSLAMDEGLGCAMARMLLKSPRPEDWDEVLSLFQDVFGVPRLIPRMGTKARTLLPIKDMTSSKQDAKVTDQDTAKSSGGSETAAVGETTASAEAADMNQADESTSLAISVADESSAMITSQIPEEKVPMGNNALSVLMETCLSLRAYDTATNYWDLITESYGVSPDRDNYHSRMRILSQLSDSAGCLSLIEEMAANGVQLNQQLFFIAINGCRRAGKISGFNDALKILDLMRKYEVDITSKVVTAFIRTATVTENTEAMKRAWSRVGPGLFNIHQLIDPTGKSVDKIARDLEACQEMVSLSDAMLSRMFQNKLNKADQEFAETVTNARGKIQKYLNEYFNQKRKEADKEVTMIQKVKAFRQRNEVPKQDHEKSKKLTVQSTVGRWQKYKEDLGPGEESLIGLSFKPRRRNSVGEAVDSRRMGARPKEFMASRRTEYTAHYKPEEQRKVSRRARSYD